MIAVVKVPAVILGQIKTFDAEGSMLENARAQACFMDESVVLRFEVDYSEEPTRVDRSEG